MSNIVLELERCRKRWAECKKKGDSVGMNLWEKIGKSLKSKINESAGKQIVKEDGFELMKRLINETDS